MAQDQAKLKKRLELLLKLPENLTCADCGKRGPRWASANLGVFFCIECSGIHRNLGVHISFVRSVNLDSWTKAQVDFLEEWGNGRANEYYEANIPPHVTKPRDGDSVRVLEKFIRDKYEYKKYIAKTIPPKRNIKLDELDDDNKRRNSATTRSRPSNSSSSNSNIPSNVSTGPVLTSVAQKRDIPTAAPVVTTNKANSDSLLDFLDEPVVSNVNTTSNQSNDIFSSFISAPVAPSIQQQHQQHQQQQQQANQFASVPNAFPVSPSQGSYNNQPNYQSYNTHATAPAPPLAVHIPAHHPPAPTKPQVSTADILSLYSNPVQSLPPSNPAYHGSTVPPSGYPGVPIYSQPNTFNQPNNYGQPQPYYTANYGQPNVPPPPVPNQVPFNQGYGNPNQPPNVFNQFQQNTGPYGGYNQR